MNDILSAVLLGIVEGLTEFLPVSSTAHLLIVQDLLGFQPPGEVFPIVIQFGAILAVVAVYWRRFWDVLITLPSSRESQNFTLGVIVAFLPAAVIGAALHGFIKSVLFAPAIAPWVIATTLILGGLLILVFERIAPPPRYLDGDKLPLSKAFQIGLFQVLAIVPGVSRSGATILGAELVGIDRKAAALFTFYLAVPTMFGATVFDLWKNRHVLNMHAGLDIAIGFVVSFIVALFVVRTFIGFIGRYGLKPFGWYRIVAGAAIIAVLMLR
ncbi:MAG: undecaprenyl-diphosphate phosphatase [Alphaproteobacteria bacterium]|nr:undecaprenyl-diphosphate phosphatase [Alphaproteobacteria bacterium]MBV9419880.1 undecaprenyl-diphosphate phosphatase [Alphaproteobacteria bacterium]